MRLIDTVKRVLRWLESWRMLTLHVRNTGIGSLYYFEVYLRRRNRI